MILSLCGWAWPVKIDNTTLPLKVSLRLAMLRESVSPLVLETHGGAGEVYKACYRELPGIVIEKSPAKCELLSSQRPTWPVYEADCVKALRSGLAADRPVNCLDVDPYGDPWPTIAAFLESRTEPVPVLHVVVNDGLKQKVKLACAWDCSSLRPAVDRFGNDLYKRYPEICKFLMEHHAGRAGYRLARWHCYSCGHSGDMTHYLARLERA
jgi:hypothetical protein